MAFFDDLQQSISRTGQNAVKKTNDIMEVNRLKQDISAREKDNNECFASIGRIIYEKHTDKISDADIDMFISRINRNACFFANHCLYSLKKIRYSKYALSWIFPCTIMGIYY